MAQVINLPGAINNGFGTWEGFLFGDFTEVGQRCLKEADHLTAAEAMTRAGLNWSVDVHDLVAVVNGKQLEVPGRRVLTRTDTGAVIGDVGRHYKAFEHSNLMTFADDVLSQVEGGWIGAGELNGGSQVVGLLNVGEGVKIGGDTDELVLLNLLLRGSYDGSWENELLAIPTRFACWNGNLWYVPGTVRSYKVKHTTHNELSLADAREALEVAFTYFAEVGELSNALAGVKLTKRQGVKLIKSIYPAPADPKKQVKAATIADRVQTELLAKWQGTDDLGNIRNTAYGLLQAVADYDDHDSRTRKVNGRPEHELRFLRATQPSPLKDRALAVIREYAQV